MRGARQPGLEATVFDEAIDFIRSWYGTRGPIALHEPRFGARDRALVIDAIDSTFVSSVGAYVDRFEHDLGAYVRAGRAVATVNGTSALHVALRLAGVQPGDEVITQPLSFIATANAISYAQATPVFVDVDRETLGLCPRAAEQFLDAHAARTPSGCLDRRTGQRVSALVPMHTFGHPCHVDALVSLGERWGIPVVEDAAEALGSTRGGRACGTFGRVGIYSFNGNKTITCGGGGALVTDDEELGRRAKHLTTTAKVPHRWAFAHDEVGYNYRMPNLNAALACAQLEQLDAFLADKRALAVAYAALFADCRWATFVREPAGCWSNYWLNAVLVHEPELRDRFLAATNDAHVATRPAWTLLCDMDVYRHCPCGELANARWLAPRLVNLPSSARRAR
jgi:aminotransferase in exopolysaccharide biosynthesis